MNLHIELSGDLEAALKAHAEAHGISPDSYVNQVVEKALLADNSLPNAKLPRRTGRGILAKYGPAPSAEEIDKVRREMWANFPRDIE